MKSLSIFALAGILAPAAALAQTVTPPPEEDTPPATLRTPAPRPTPAPLATPAPAPGVTWQGPTPAPPAAPSPAIARPAPVVPPPAIARPAPPAPPARVVIPAPPPRAAPLPPPAVVHRAPPPGGHVEMHGRNVVMDGPGARREHVVVRRRTMGHEGRHHADARRHVRIERGHRVPGQWLHPRFHIRDFGRYGLYQPMWGGRWIRYYDDALLVDPYGQVIDGQWGMAWDEYADDWRRGHDGLPEYIAYYDSYRDDGDHAWVDGDDGYAGHHGYDQGGYGHQYPRGAGAIVVTETITTTAPTAEEKVWYENVHQRPRANKRKPRLKGGRG
jgi:Ni/Co efflux regulator RcnB